MTDKWGIRGSDVPAQHPARRSRRGVATTAAVVGVLALVLGACGSGRSTSESNSTDTTITTDAASVGFGDMSSPCGEGEAAGATQLGVTDETITMGYGDDAGYQGAPGLNHSQSETIEAMIDWCNAQGGINGRQIKGNYYDAKITEVNNVMTDACSQVFMLVGQGFSLDSSQEQTRLGCSLATVPAWTVSPAFANGRLMVQPLPNPVDVVSIENAFALAKMFPDKVKKAAVMTANYPATKDTTDKAQLAFPEAGWTFLDCGQTYSIAGETDWRPFVQRLKDCGAEVVVFSGSPAPNFQNVLDAAAQLDYEPIWSLDTNFYDPDFAAWNVSGNADNVYIRLTFTPFEQAASNPATQKYLDLMKDSGGTPSVLGGQAASAFLLWASAAKDCGSTLTSTCVMDKLHTVDEWNGGGLHAPTNPGANLPSTCGMLVTLTGTEFSQAYPSQSGQFDCDPKYNVTITGPVVDQANLDSNRVSQAAG